MIISVPNPVLTTPAKPIIKIDKKVRDIVEKMKKTLIDSDNPKGVGLAAPQIGVPLRIFISRPKETSLISVFLNPEIIWKSHDMSEILREEDTGDKKTPSLKKNKKLEGCLSIPNVWGHLRRPSKVKLRFMNLKGEIKEEEFSDFAATIIQHETDHINGILFTQRVLEQKEKLYEIETDEKGEEKLIEIEI